MSRWQVRRVLEGRAFTWCAWPRAWSADDWDGIQVQAFPTWREAYAYADAMARSGR